MNRKRRLTIAAFLGVISLGITSLSFSIAWYASSTQLDIDGLNITVDADRDLKISTSTDLASFKGKLTYGELDRVEKFDPCSSMFKSEWMDQKASKPEMYRYDMPVTDSSGRPHHNKATKGYYSQSLYLLANDDVLVTIDTETFSLVPDVTLNEMYIEKVKARFPEYTKEELLIRLNSLVDCMRISILDPDEETYNYTILDPTKDEEILLGGREDLGKDDYYDYYTSSTGMYETVYGEVENRETIKYGERADEDIETTGELTSFNAKTKKNVHPFDLEASIENGLVIKTEDSIALNEVEEKIAIPVKADKPKEIVLSIYMEGWDEDCTNAHMGGSFILDVDFKVLRED